MINIDTIEAIIYNVLSFFQDYGMYFMIYGLVTCFIGFRIYKLQISLVGAIGGAILGYLITQLIPETAPDNIMLLGALAGALVAYLFNLIGIFVTTYLMVTFMVFIFFLSTSPDKNIETTFMISSYSGIASGVLVTVFTKYATIIQTAVTGAMIFVLGYTFHSDSLILIPTAGALLIGLLTLAPLGCYIQFTLERLIQRRKDRRHEKRDKSGKKSSKNRDDDYDDDDFLDDDEDYTNAKNKSRAGQKSIENNKDKSARQLARENASSQNALPNKSPNRTPNRTNSSNNGGNNTPNNRLSEERASSRMEQIQIRCKHCNNLVILPDKVNVYACGSCGKHIKYEGQ